MVPLDSCSLIHHYGDTPSGRQQLLSPNPRAHPMHSLENQNPFRFGQGSHAKAMIEAMDFKDALVPGQRIMEPPGNTGIALPHTVGIKGNPITILLPDSVSVERRHMRLTLPGARNHPLLPVPKAPTGRSGAPKTCA